MNFLLTWLALVGRGRGVAVVAVGVDVGGHVALALIPGVAVRVGHAGGLAAPGLGVAVILGLAVRVGLAAAQVVRPARGLGVGTVGVQSTA